MALAAVLACAILASFLAGRYPVPPHVALAVLASKLVHIDPFWRPELEAVILKIRLPRIVAAAGIGAALSASGAAYQGMFRNPLVSPDILGVSAGRRVRCCAGHSARDGPRLPFKRRPSASAFSPSRLPI